MHLSHSSRRAEYHSKQCYKCPLQTQKYLFDQSDNFLQFTNTFLRLWKKRERGDFYIFKKIVEMIRQPPESIQIQFFLNCAVLVI